MQSNVFRILIVVSILNILPEAACFSVPTSRDSNSKSTTTRSSDHQHGSTNFYTYKSMKRMEIPALLYSIGSNAACKILRRRPQVVPPSISISSEQSSQTSSIEPSASTETNHPRIAIVTGSNTGVGYETAKSLVLNHGYHVIIASRSPEKGMRACESINAALVNYDRVDTATLGGKALWEGPLDLSDLDSVRSFASKIKENPNYKTIDVLINNAGVNSAGATTASATADELRPLDVVFSTNFLGHFLLTNLLLDECERVVNLSSVMHHFPVYSSALPDDELNDIESVAFWKDKALTPPMEEVMSSNETTTSSKKKMTVRKTYGPSKLAALLFSSELQRRYGDKMVSIAVNPGAVSSDIWRNYSKMQQKLFRLLYLTPEQGCQTSVAAAVLDFWSNDEETAKDQTLYLQPYRMPLQRSGKKKKPPFPMLEMLGPFMGYRLTTPRLPKDDGVRASQSLFQVCEELTQCKFPPR